MGNCKECRQHHLRIGCHRPPKPGIYFTEKQLVFYSLLLFISGYLFTSPFTYDAGKNDGYSIGQSMCPSLQACNFLPIAPNMALWFDSELNLSVVCNNSTGVIKTQDGLSIKYECK